MGSLVIGRFRVRGEECIVIKGKSIIRGEIKEDYL